MPAEIPTSRRSCAVLGSPIEHSLSPVLHRTAYAELGLDWTYDAREVTAAELPAFVAALHPPWRGLSLTMPLKRAAVVLCHSLEASAELTGSVNTLTIDADGSRSGYNTDIDGFVRALGEAGVERLGSVVIVGAGATAASALVAAARMGATVASVLARSPERTQPLQALGEALGVEVLVHPLTEAGVERLAESLDERDAVVSTVPAAGQSAALADRLVRLAPVVFDVVYAPAVTPLVEAAWRRGGRGGRGGVVIPGFELLVHQAAGQVELMTGVTPAPLEAMRRAGLAALSSR